MKEEFNGYIDKLKDAYDNNPNKVSKEVRDTLIRLKLIKRGKFLSDVNKSTVFLIIEILLIVLIGLLSYKTGFVYYGGLIFFIAGVFIGLYVPYFGIVFLFSHGLTGLCIMVAGLCSSVFNLLLSGDTSISLYIICAIAILIFIIAFISMD